MKNNVAQPQLSTPKTLSAFAGALTLLEATSAYAAVQSGDWSLFFFTQPAALVVALIVGAWLGLMLGASEKTSPRFTSKPKNTSAPADAACQARAFA